MAAKKNAAAAPAPEATTKGKFQKTAAAPAPAPSKAPAKAPKPEKEAGEAKGPRGENRPYKVLAKECPFREGSIREELWGHITSVKTTGDARALDSRISSTFMNELAGKGVIEFTG